MVEMIGKVEMKKTNNPLQNQMREDIKKLKSIPEVIVEADKTANLYLVKPEAYIKHLTHTMAKSTIRQTPPPWTG